MDTATALASSDRIWESEILSALEQYIRIPSRSPFFEPAWAAAGHLDAAVQLVAEWCRAQAPHVPGLKVDVVQLHDASGGRRTPLLFMEAPGTGKGTVLLYGHLDKQPESTGWREGLAPWEPKREGDRLYGRGSADDGYAAFACVAALRLLGEQKLPFARCVVLIEAGEESGSPDLPAYIDHLAERIGTPGLVICLDSGCSNYEQLWLTTSLRGVIVGDLRVEILSEGVHSGDGSGIVPSSFRILRQLLDRVEDVETGRVKLAALHVEIPKARLEQAKAVCELLGREVYSGLPFVDGARPVTGDVAELVLNRTWRPALSITGADGLPALESAGNVLRPFTSVKLSLRIPPRLEPQAAARALKEALERDPPYGARVTFEGEKASPGWDAPQTAPWLEEAMDGASRACFGKTYAAMGEGGSIAFMDLLGRRYPEAQFLITGVLGPGSNAHGPNEHLHLPAAKKLTACVAGIIAAHHRAL